MNNIYDAKKIGQRIRAERKKTMINGKAATLESFGDEIGVARQTLAKWEKGDESTEPTLWNFLDMCNLFGCELGYLLCEYDCKTRTKADIRAETGLTESTITKLQSWNRYDGTLADKLAHGILDLLNKLFELGLGDMLLDLVLFEEELRQFNRDTSNGEDALVSLMVGNYSKSRQPGTAIIGQADYYEFQMLKFERAFGQILKAMIEKPAFPTIRDIDWATGECDIIHSGKE